MKRPSFQFYPGDWTSNPNLRRCSFTERGIWLELMCLMHDQQEYGVLRWPLKDIAQAVSCKPAELLALVRKGVLKGSDTQLTEEFIYTPRSGRKDGAPVTLMKAQDGPIWYSSRMVKDEYVRTHAGSSTRFGANKDDCKVNADDITNDSPKPSPTRRHGEDQSDNKGDGSSSSSSSSVKEEREGEKTRFARPTLAQIAEVMLEKGSPGEAEKFWNHYESNGWKVVKNPMKNWKAAIAQWLSRDFRANNAGFAGTSQPVAQAQRFPS